MSVLHGVLAGAKTNTQFRCQPTSPSHTATVLTKPEAQAPGCIPATTFMHTQRAKKQTGAGKCAHALRDPSSRSSRDETVVSLNPLDAGPCGDLLSSSSTCWVRRTLIWGSIGIGLAVPAGVVWMGDEVCVFTA